MTAVRNKDAVSATSARPQTAAHRGGSPLLRENTLPAIRSAIAAGADYVEVDPCVLADGSVMLLHDDTLDRLWNIPAAASTLNLESILAIGDADHRPPLLTDALPLFASCASTLLVDVHSVEVAIAAYDLVAAANVHVSWCGSLEAVVEIRRRDPSAGIWAPWWDEGPMDDPALLALRPQFLNMKDRVASADTIRQAHALGHSVAVWTLNDTAQILWARRSGVDVITTDDLALVQQTLATAEG